MSDTEFENEKQKNIYEISKLYMKFHYYSNEMNKIFDLNIEYIFEKRS